MRALLTLPDVSEPEMPRRLATFIYIALLALMFWAPLPLGSNRAWSVNLLAFIIFTLSGLTLGLVASNKLRPPKTFFQARWLHLAFIGFIIWQFFQQIIIDSANSWQQTQGLINTLAFYALFNLVLIYINSISRLKTLLWCITLSGLFQALFGTLSTLSGLEWSFFMVKETGHGVATGTFVNRNHLAGFLELALACGLGLLISDLKDIKFSSMQERLHHYLKVALSSKVLLRVMLGAMVVGLIMTRSRMGNFAFFSTMLGCGFLYMVLRQRFTRSTLILFASLIVIDTLIISQWFGLDKLAERLEKTANNIQITRQVATDSFDTGTVLANPTGGNNPAVTNPEPQRAITIRGEARDDAWGEALPMTRDYLITGSGFGSFYTLFPQYRQGHVKGYFDHVHNDYIEFLIEFGLPGLLALLFISGSGITLGIKAQRQRRQPIAIGAGFAATMGISALALHSFTDFNLYIPANGAMLTVIVAIGVLSFYLPTKVTTD